jgi:hypothetical protein
MRQRIELQLVNQILSKPNVDTEEAGYPRIQALSQDKEQGVHPYAATKAVASDYTSL